MKPALIIGHTEEGHEVVYARLFTWKDERGLPIDFAASFMMQQNLHPAWPYEIEGALWLGLTEEQILAELKEVFNMIYVPQDSKEALRRVTEYMEFRKTPNPFTQHALEITKP